jgi:hypothetical protein
LRVAHPQRRGAFWRWQSKILRGCAEEAFDVEALVSAGLMAFGHSSISIRGWWEKAECMEHVTQ